MILLMTFSTEKQPPEQHRRAARNRQDGQRPEGGRMSLGTAQLRGISDHVGAVLSHLGKVPAAIVGRWEPHGGRSEQGPGPKTALAAKRVDKHTKCGHISKILFR